MKAPSKDELVAGWAPYLKKYGEAKGYDLKVYVEKEGGLKKFGNTTAESLSISDSAIEFIEEVLDSLNSEISLSLELTTEESDADIKVFKHGFDISGKGDSSGVTEYEYSTLGNKNSPDSVNFKFINVSVNTLYGDDSSNFWKYVFVHELGHALGLEHPFDLSDGDGVGDESNPTVDTTLMGYGPPGDGNYPTMFKSVDISALKEIWGEKVTTEKGDSFTKKTIYDLSQKGLTNTIAWKDLSLAGEEKDVYDKIDWSKVDIKKFQKFQSDNIVWGWVGFGDLTKKQYKGLKWSGVDLSGFTQKDYDSVKWDNVDFKQIQKHQELTLEWEKVDFYKVFNSKSHKKIKWSKVDFTDFEATNYAAINWSKVSFAGKSSVPKPIGFKLSEVDFYQLFQTSSFKKVDWSGLDFSGFGQQDYGKIDWSKVKYLGAKSVGKAKGLDWASVNLDEIFSSKKVYKKVDWSEVTFENFSLEEYGEVEWDKVALGGKKSADYSKLDWSKVINDDSFSVKAATKVDWSQISASSLDSDALSKLQNDTFSGKNKKLTAWLDKNTSSTISTGSQNGVSFAGIGQPQVPGGLTTTSDPSGSTTEVVLAAVEKQPTLV